MQYVSREPHVIGLDMEGLVEQLIPDHHGAHTHETKRLARDIPAADLQRRPAGRGRQHDYRKGRPRLPSGIEVVLVRDDLPSTVLAGQNEAAATIRRERRTNE